MLTNNWNTFALSKYVDGQLSVAGSSEEFNSTIYEVSQRNKSNGVDILPTEASEKDDFLRKFRDKIIEDKE